MIVKFQNLKGRGLLLKNNTLSVPKTQKILTKLSNDMDRLKNIIVESETILRKKIESNKNAYLYIEKKVLRLENNIKQLIEKIDIIDTSLKNNIEFKPEETTGIDIKQEILKLLSKLK